MDTMRTKPARTVLPAELARLLRPRHVPGLAGISLYLAHERSGLGRIAEAAGTDDPPYWAFCWPGGLALARYIADLPGDLRGKSVLEIGSGCGLVSIAAAKAEAACVTAVEKDAVGRAATALNAAHNGVDIAIAAAIDATGKAACVDLVLAGDVFYDPGVAREMIAVLDRFVRAGTPVLVGDPGRRDLPLQRLDKCADYAIADVGTPLDTPRGRAAVYAYRLPQGREGAGPGPGDPLLR